MRPTPPSLCRHSLIISKGVQVRDYTQNVSELLALCLPVRSNAELFTRDELTPEGLKTPPDATKETACAK